MNTHNYIWIPDKEFEWILAEIDSDNGDQIQASPTPRSRAAAFYGNGSITDKSLINNAVNEKSTFQRGNLCEFDVSHLEDLSDLCLMNNLHEGPLIHILRRRWLNDCIYTYAGDVLISLNPYKLISGLYDNPLAYFDIAEDNDGEDDQTETDNDRKTSLLPHAYYLANAALKRMLLGSNGHTILDVNAKINQSVIVSGESGSGKTEASKHVINFLICANQKMTSNSDKVVASQTDRIKDVIIESSVVFEAFGNSKTVRNDNSSRFGKYIKLQYTQDNALISATTETFLLEKSRLVAVGKGERNYHIFYQLLRGLHDVNPAAKNDFLLTNIDDFRILTAGDCTVIHTPETDKEEFLALCKALSSVGCSSEDITSLWSVLAVILHLGNASFTPSEDEHIPVTINVPTAPIKLIADILGVDHDDLQRSLTTQSLTIAKRASVKTKTLSVADSTNNVLGLIKWLYSRIFGWLLSSINDCHSSLITETRQPVKFLGILDIFGFEILGTNSFEQLCINFTNERLQQQFNDRIFASEQELYMKEGLNWSTITYQDNQNVIDMISKKPTGLLYLLEEHGMMNRVPDDMALLRHMNQTHSDNADHIYIKSRFGTDGMFHIKHFAGVVTYQIEGFISKNNDSLQDDLTELIQTSRNPFLQKIIRSSAIAAAASSAASEAPALNRTSRPAKAMASAMTVSLQFRGQLDTLINALRATEPHYIKCIKPNDMKSSGIFQSNLTMNQLRYSGILEVVRIRREGFPIRMKFFDFYTKYEFFSRLHRDTWKRPHECDDNQALEYCQYITSKYLPSTAYQYGTSLLFLRENGINLMQIALNRYASSYVTRIQKMVRRVLQTVKYQMIRQKVAIIQCIVRKFTAKCKLLRLQHAKRVYEEKLERERLAELARQEEERRRQEELLRKQKEERLRREAEEKERIRMEELKRQLEEEALRQEIAAAEARKRAEEKRIADAQAKIYSSVLALHRNHKLDKRLTLLYTACETGDVATLGRANLGFNISDFKIRWKYRNLDSPLRVAIRFQQIKVVETLKSMILSDLKDRNGNSLLHLALNHGSEKTFQYLFNELESNAMKSAPAVTQSKPSENSDREITSAWFHKARPGQRKIRRWCVLKSDKILYFAKPDDKVPRAAVEFVAGTNILRTLDEPHSFEIESDSLPIRRNMFGNPLKKSMVFVADNEIVATEWVYHIQCALGVAPLRKSPVIYLNPTIRQSILSKTNAADDTLLHAIIKSPNLSTVMKATSNTLSATDQELVMSLLSTADWLTLYGVNVLAKDSTNATIADYSASLGYPLWQKFAAGKEAMKSNTEMKNDLENSRYSNVGYTYLNLYIQRSFFKNFTTAFADGNMSMLISLNNSSGHPVEMSRTIRGPMLTTKTFILWGSMTKFRTPLNVLMSDSYLQFDIFVNGASTAEYSYKYPINVDTVKPGFIDLTSTSGSNMPTLTLELSFATA